MTKKAWILWLSGLFLLTGLLLANWNDLDLDPPPKLEPKYSPSIIENTQEYNIELLLKEIYPGKEKSWMNLLRVTNLLDKFPNEEKNPLVLLELLNDTLQKFWMRKPGVERYQLSDDSLSPKQKTIILAAFQDLGLYEEIPPLQENNHFRKYDCAILTGALQNRVEIRFQFLLDLWKQGLRFDRLYVLSGHRKLVAEHEPIMAELTKLKIDRNETNMMIYIITKMLKEQNIIQEQDLDIIYVYAPVKTNEARANTTNNISHWNKQYGISGEISQKDKTLLLISSQPYAIYQATVVHKVLSDQYTYSLENLNFNRVKLGNGYDIETIGPKGKPDVLMASLDTLARELYELVPLIKQRLQEKMNNPHNS